MTPRSFLQIVQSPAHQGDWYTVKIEPGFKVQV